MKKGCMTIDDENISTRLTKSWSIGNTLVRDGIRFCPPATIKQLFLSLAVPTLTYGLELCNLTQTILNKLDTEARKALKSMFSISPFSRNFLNSLLNVEYISTTLIKNKLGLLTRLLENECTSKVIFNALQSDPVKDSFLYNAIALCNMSNVDFMFLVVSKKFRKISNPHAEIPKVTFDILTQCLSNWNDPAQRKTFRDILEERVVRQT
jgi:hypothetical protein